MATRVYEKAVGLCGEKKGEKSKYMLDLFTRNEEVWTMVMMPVVVNEECG